MPLGSASRFQRRMLPLLAIVLVFIAIAASTEYSLERSNTSAYSFGIYWPAPTAYSSGNALPNVFLRINYTGAGIMNYTYIISVNSSILATGEVGVRHNSAFTVLAFSPVPAVDEAQIIGGNRTVFQQNLYVG